MTEKNPEWAAIVRPGDALILGFEDIDVAEAADIKTRLAEHLSPIGVRPMIISNVQHMAIARPDQANVSTDPEGQMTMSDALVQCARALAFTYGGSPRPPDTEPEACACWDAMHAAYSALGVTDTRDLTAYPHHAVVPGEVTRPQQAR